MDTKFSMALHVLLYVSETDQLASSERLATSVGTNSSHIRKLTGLLKKAGLLTSQQGKSGFHLAQPASDISLADIYRAVYPDRALLKVHQDSNPACPIGQRIDHLLRPTFDQAEAGLLAQLSQETLADLITQLYALK